MTRILADTALIEWAVSSAGLEQGTSNSQVGGSSPPGLAILFVFHYGISVPDLGISASGGFQGGFAYWPCSESKKPLLLAPGFL